MGLTKLPGQREETPYLNIAIILPVAFFCLILGAGIYAIASGRLDTAGFALYNLYFMLTILFAVAYGIFGFFMTRRVLLPTLLHAGCLTVCTILLWITATALGVDSFVSSFDQNTYSVAGMLLRYYIRTLLLSSGTVAIIAGMIKVIRNALRP